MIVVKRTIALVIGMLAIQGCAQQNVHEALENLSHDCERHYTFSANTGGVGGLGGSITVAGTADCKPTPQPAPLVTPAQ